MQKSCMGCGVVGHVMIPICFPTPYQMVVIFSNIILNLTYLFTIINIIGNYGKFLYDFSFYLK